MLEITVEGVYESDVGTGQKTYTDFNYKIKTSRLTENGVFTHIAKRFIPMLIANDKSKKAIFSRLRSFNVLSIEKFEDNEECIIGKNINTLNAMQLQDLACTFDLYDVPLNGKHTLNVIREKAISAYLKKVWKIDLDEKNSDGTPKYDLDEVIIEVPKGYLEKKKKESQKVKVSDLIKAGQTTAEEVSGVAEDNSEENAPDNDKFPSVGSLVNNALNVFKQNS